jgi:hypothetical protein
MKSLVKELADTISSSPVSVPPLLVLYGDNDQFTGIGSYEAWVKSLREVGNLHDGKAVVSNRKIEGGDHFWQGEALNHMLIEVERWING